MRRGRYADFMPIACRNVSNQLQTHLREEVQLFSDKTIALSGDLPISTGVHGLRKISETPCRTFAVRIP